MDAVYTYSCAVSPHAGVAAIHVRPGTPNRKETQISVPSSIIYVRPTTTPPIPAPSIMPSGYLTSPGWLSRPMLQSASNWVCCSKQAIGVGDQCVGFNHCSWLTYRIPRGYFSPITMAYLWSHFTSNSNLGLRVLVHNTSVFYIVQSLVEQSQDTVSFK